MIVSMIPVIFHGVDNYLYRSIGNDDDNDEKSKEKV